MKIPVDLHRFAEQIENLESHPIETDRVMLYGSSFFAKWFYDRSREQLSAATDGKLQITNHGFGGAIVDELLYYYPRLVMPYKPSAVVLRTGYNDIRRGLSPQETLFLTQRLVSWLQADNPQIRVLLLKVFDVRRANDHDFALLRQYNQLLEAYAAAEENVECLDINGFFYDDPRNMGDRCKLRNVFVDDGLHLTDAAYEEMAPYFGKKVLDALMKLK